MIGLLLAIISGKECALMIGLAIICHLGLTACENVANVTFLI